MNVGSRNKDKPQDTIGLAFDRMANGIDALFVLEESLPAEKRRLLDVAPERLPRFIQMKIQSAHDEVAGGIKMLRDEEEARRVESDRVIASVQAAIKRSKKVVARAHKILGEPAP